MSGIHRVYSEMIETGESLEANYADVLSMEKQETLFQTMERVRSYTQGCPLIFTYIERYLHT